MAFPNAFLPGPANSVRALVAQFDVGLFFRRLPICQSLRFSVVTLISRSSRAAFCMQFAYVVKFFIFYLETDLSVCIENRRGPNFVVESPGRDLDICPVTFFQDVFILAGLRVFDVG